MNKKLLSRLVRAITAINAHDSDRIFLENLMEVRHYARFMHDERMEEIIRITNDALSKARHTKREKEEITEKLRSLKKDLHI